MVTVQATAIHPGEFLREILTGMAMTQVALAQAIGVPASRVARLLKGACPITAELALRLGRALGQTPQYWLNLQTTYDPKVVQTEMKDSLLACPVRSANVP